MKAAPGRRCNILPPLGAALDFSLNEGSAGKALQLAARECHQPAHSLNEGSAGKALQRAPVTTVLPLPQTASMKAAPGRRCNSASTKSPRSRPSLNEGSAGKALQLGRIVWGQVEEAASMKAAPGRRCNGTAVFHLSDPYLPQ